MKKTTLIKTISLFLMLEWVFVLSGFSQQHLLLSESFEINNGTIPPSGWVSEQVSGSELGISFETSATNPTILRAIHGNKFVQYHSGTIASGSTRLKTSEPFSTEGYYFVLVEIAWFEDPGFPADSDRISVQWSTDNLEWHTDSTLMRYNAVAGWKHKYLMLPTGAYNQPELYLGFLFTSGNGNNCALDRVRVTGVTAAPSYITIGTGTTAVGYPFSTFYMGAKTQMLYKASQLVAAGGVAGPLYSVGFNVSTAYPQSMTNFTLKMGHTSSNSLTGWITTGMNTHYQTNYAVPGTGWRDIELTTPFTWNGTSNVVVEVCFGNNGAFTSNSNVLGTTSTGTAWHYHADNYAGCLGTNPGTVQTATPNIRFRIPENCGTAVMGFVRDAFTQQPIPCAMAMCGIQRDTADESGFFILYNLPPGPATINCTASGYVSASTTVNLISCEATSATVNCAPGPRMSGVVTDALTGMPIVGATVSVGGLYQTMTVAGGYYITPILSVSGNHPFVISATGYDDFTGAVTLVPGTTATRNCALLQTAVQPFSLTAALIGTPDTTLALHWEPPRPMRKLVYDSGIWDSTLVVMNESTLSAVKFTPLGFPFRFLSGSIYIRDSLNLPGYGTWGTCSTWNVMLPPPDPCWIYLTKANGPGGTPGTILDSVLLTPVSRGWNNFSFATYPWIDSGNFFIVVKQLGTFPDENRLAHDNADSNGRSYVKPASGSSGWEPFNGNFMVRATVQGPVVSTPMGYYYQVWRLLQGAEGTQMLWSSIYTGTETSTMDVNWPFLACWPYLWAIRAYYSPPGLRPSPMVFSNVVGKCWTADVVVCVNLSCEADQGPGTQVTLVNTTYTDTLYASMTDSGGCVHFPTVWKGNYQLKVSRFSYPTVTLNTVLMGDSVFQFDLAQQIIPPTALDINNQSLKVSWSPPRFSQYLLNENFSNGFSANQWVVAYNANWQISTLGGNPLPSATFQSLPLLTNYDQSLTTKTLSGVNAPRQKLQFDLFLDVVDSLISNTLTVDLWNGTSWSALKSYAATGGDIPWKTETLDLLSVTGNPAFKVRFRASGANSSGISSWKIDNVKIFGEEGAGHNPCVSSYNLYMNDSLYFNTQDTTFTIPPNLVVYGQTYNFCVEAGFGVDTNAMVCDTFVAQYLPPISQLAGNPFLSSCYLTWNKPPGISGEPIGLIGYNIYRNGNLVHFNPHGDSLAWNDTGLNPAIYHYDVKSRYDLGSYGYPGQFGESYSPEQIEILITGFPHFMPAWAGAPLNPMSIVVVQAICSGSNLSAGDEIGIFDGSVCVGSVKLISTISPSHPPAIAVSEDDPATSSIDGYTVGHPIEYKLWKNIQGSEYSNVTRSFPYAPNYALPNFERMDTTVVSLFTWNVPPVLVVPDTTVASGQTACFNATQTIFIAGNGTFFNIPAGGSATMIAGEKILYYPGTSVFSGGYMHGYITGNGLYCNGMPPFAPKLAESGNILVGKSKKHFRVYPNPSPGKCYISLSSGGEIGEISIDVFNMTGTLIRSWKFGNGDMQALELYDFPAGLYLLKISSGNIVETFKLVR
jgi:hypothetical protein